MKNLFFLLLLSLFQLHTFAQSNDITIGKMETIDSKILKEERKLWIYVPKAPSEEIFTKKTYPVVYLLDGSGHFYSTVGMVHQLSNVNGNTISPEMIIVGILNTNRMRDLTPSKAESDPLMPPAMLKASGGGEAFLSFIEKELMPYIEANYPTEPHKTFIGHSLGGLTVMNAFFKKPELFNAYVSIDPSMSWDNSKLFKEIKQANLDKKYQNKFLFMGFANTLSPGVEFENVEKDQNPMNAHIRSIIALDKHLEANSNQFNYLGKYYPDDDHGSVPFIAGYDALRFIFKAHRLKLGPTDFMDPKSDLVGKIERHYQELSEAFGYEKKPAEDFLNNFGYQFLSMKMYDKSEQLFQLNSRYYPDRFNVYDSLGDFYVAKGDKEKAIKHFKKALSLNAESAATKDKLTKLEKQ